MTDRYDLFEVLGRGGYADVYRAVSKATGQVAAIKTVKSLEKQGRIFDEMKIMSILNTHTHIIEAYECFLEDGKILGVAIELCDQGTLRHFTTHADLNILREYHVARLCKGAVAGLLYMHFHFVMHLDISLANILLHQDTAKISDFGCSRQFKDPNRLHYKKRGTTLFMSREMVESKGYTKQTDLWSLGIVSLILLDLLKPNLEISLEPIWAHRLQLEEIRWVNGDSPGNDALSYLSRLLKQDPMKRELISNQTFLFQKPSPSEGFIPYSQVLGDNNDKKTRRQRISQTLPTIQSEEHVDGILPQDSATDIITMRKRTDSNDILQRIKNQNAKVPVEGVNI